MMLAVACGLMLILHGQLPEFVTGELTLTGYPSSPTSHEPFTFSCSDNETQLQNVSWIRNNVSLFFNYTTNSRRVVGGVLRDFNVSWDGSHYNLTLAQFSNIDTGSVWQCVDKGKGSNALALVKTPDEASPTPIHRDDSRHKLYTLIAVAAALLVAIATVTIICFRRKKARGEEIMEMERSDYTEGASPSNERRTSLVMSENTIYTTSNSLPRLQVVYDSNQNTVSDLYAKVIKAETSFNGNNQNTSA